MTAPLDGIRILEIGERGEQAGLLLAAAGADVVRVEPPMGSHGRRELRKCVYAWEKPRKVAR